MKQIEIDFMYIMAACSLNVELLLLLPTQLVTVNVNGNKAGVNGQVVKWN